MREEELEKEILAYRAFNRWYTGRIGALKGGLLGSPFPLAEARILYELSRRDWGPGELGKALGMDLGYTSRLLKRLQGRGLLEIKPAEEDGRRRKLVLSPAGSEAAEGLDRASRKEAASLLGGLSGEERRSLLAAMRSMEDILDPGTRPPGILLLREPEPGDLGWVIARHGALYAEEYGWNAEFEALVARIVADFAAAHDPLRERCWIAELDGEAVGSIFCVKIDDETAKLRLLLLEPRARGLGLGRRLVEECMRFAARAGYKRMVLWTNSVLAAARGIYAAAGFRLTGSEEGRLFGKELVSETWEAEL